MKLKTKPTEVEIDIGDNGFMSFRQLSSLEFGEIISPYSAIINEKGTGDDIKEKLENLRLSEDKDILMSLSNCFVELFKKMVCGWRGITDEEGNALSFNGDNINLICVHDFNFVIGIIPIAIDELKKKKDESLKNLKPGQVGILSQAGSPADNVGISDEVTVVMNAPSQPISTQ